MIKIFLIIMDSGIIYWNLRQVYFILAG